MSRWLVAALVLAIAPSAEGSTVVVRPDGTGDYPTIQTAIDAVVDGDVVLLADGTFAGPGNRDLDFLGKSITVTSEGGDPTGCVIDCQGSGRGVHFRTGEGREARLSSITIQNGSISGPSPDPAGGGILCQGSASPTISNCIVRECLVLGAWPTPAHGGGIACADGSSPLIEGCEIVSNQADAGSGPPVAGGGGGIACLDQSSPTIRDCRIAGNLATNGAGLLSDTVVAVEGTRIEENGGGACEGCPPLGGGVHCGVNSVTVMSDCTIAGNRAEGSGIGGGGWGGGIYSVGSDQIVGCRILGNVADGGEGAGGGGAYLNGAAHIARTIVSGNAAGPHPSTVGIGGGIFWEQSGGAIEDCVITGNESSLAAGLYLRGPARVVGCSILSNGNPNGDATEGGGLWIWGAVTIERTIAWFNCASDGVGTNLRVRGDGSATVICSAVDPGPGSAGGAGDLTFQGPQVLTDPLICAAAPCQAAPTELGHYELAVGSPCLPDASPCGQLIGALGAGCSDPVPTRSTTWGAIKARDMTRDSPGPPKTRKSVATPRSRR